MENKNICIVYSHTKVGDLIWQLPYIKAISLYHKKNIVLITRKETRAKIIFKDLDYIEVVKYNQFRKNINYWIDTFKLFKFLKSGYFSHLYVLDKISRPAIAAKFAGIKNIIGPGLGNQKKWLTCKNFFNEEDWNLTYSDQSQKLLLLNNISVKNIFPELKINFERDDIDINIKKIDNKIISFGIDSSEEFRMWYEELFVELANVLFEKNLFEKIYLICSKRNDHMASKIISLSKKKYFINCSKYDLANIMGILKKSSFFVGNNSGPMNMAAALGTKSFGLICNDPVSELKYSNILAITPDNYDENILNRDRNDMKNLTVEKVSNFILERIE